MNTRFGELIESLLFALITYLGVRIGAAHQWLAERLGYCTSTVYRWRQGTYIPPLDTVEQIALVGHEVGMDRHWGGALLRAARHPLPEQFVNTHWGPTTPRVILHNLSEQHRRPLIGRQAELHKLFGMLSPQVAFPLISVDGIGGVGKSTLVLEAAFQCLEASQGRGDKVEWEALHFEAIIFTSARQQILTPEGIFDTDQSHRTLRDIFREIAKTLDRPEITQASPDEQPERVRQALSRQRTLLIIDNMETIEDKESIHNFLYTLPPGIKVILTTRERMSYHPLRLLQLEEGDSLALIREEAEAKCVPLSEEEVQALHDAAQGIPLVIIYSMGRMAMGHSITQVLDTLRQPNGEIARYCFKASVDELRDQPAHALLMAIAIFPKAPVREALLHTADLYHNPRDAEIGLGLLHQLSLVTLREGRYEMLPLTREYAHAELTAHPTFKEAARERWVAWYMRFVEEHGGEDWGEWHIEFDHLEEEKENIFALLAYLTAHNRYETVVELYKILSPYLGTYGHWDDQMLLQKWLIQNSIRRGDQEALAISLNDHAFKLVLLGQDEQLTEAEYNLQEAANIAEHAAVMHKLFTITNFICLYMRRNRYDEARLMIKEAERIATLLDESSEQVRSKVGFLYYKAQLHYHLIELLEAQACYHQVLNLAQSINWQRAVIYAQNWLADIALARGELDVATHLLATGLPVAERNKDRRRIAFYHRSYAYLARAQGDEAAARRWAEQALDGFERLGMQPEVIEMGDFLAGRRSDRRILG